MTPAEYSVRKLTTREDFSDFADTFSRAYPGDFPTGLPADRKEKWIARMQQINEMLGSKTYFGCFQENHMVGGMILDEFSMTMFDQQIKAGGVGGVCVELLHKKQHVAKFMLEFAHSTFQQKNIHLSCLWPFHPSFYGISYMGYGRGGKMNQYRFRPNALVNLTDSSGHLTYCDVSDAKTITECFNRYARKTHGMILRNEMHFTRVLQKPYVVAFQQGNKIKGYIIFKFKNLSEENFIQNAMIIDELIYEDPEVLNELLSFIRKQHDQIDEIIYTTPDEAFHYLLFDPLIYRPKMFLTAQESNIQGLGIMYRILNLREFFSLAAIKEHNFGSQTLTLKITVQDTFIPENAGSVIVQFNEGNSIILNEETGTDVELKIDISYLSSLIMGVTPFHTFFQYGLVTLSDSKYAEQINKLFLVRAPPQTIEQF